MERVEIRCQSAPWNRGIEVMVQGPAPYGSLSVAKNIVFEVVEAGMLIPPTAVLGYDQAQTLMDDLWNCGLRPTEGAGSAGAMAKVEAHLKDMRTIAFKKLGIEDTK